MAKPTALAHSEPDIFGGTPVFVGTRVPVKTLYGYLEAAIRLTSSSIISQACAEARRSLNWPAIDGEVDDAEIVEDKGYYAQSGWNLRLK